MERDISKCLKPLKYVKGYRNFEIYCCLKKTLMALFSIQVLMRKHRGLPKLSTRVFDTFWRKIILFNFFHILLQRKIIKPLVKHGQTVLL